MLYLTMFSQPLAGLIAPHSRRYKNTVELWDLGLEGNGASGCYCFNVK